MTQVETTTTVLLLFAEDDHEDWILIEEALEECPDMKYERVQNGIELLGRLKQDPLPHMIFLDLKMPKMDGPTALTEIRADPELRHIPVVVLTTSKLETDVVRSYTEGANSYMVKPMSFDGMARAMEMLRRYWTELVILPPARRPTNP